MARPLLEIDETQVEKLAMKMWSMREIAAFMDCDESTIRGRFPAIYAKGREKGKAKLRDLQFKAAEHGNATILIWLGKQYLDQTDKQEIEMNAEVKTESKLSREEIKKILEDIKK